MLNNIGVVILAAGKGTRLGCTDIPKAMLDIGGKPMVAYIVETLESMGFTPEQMVVVVGFKREKVKEYFKDRVAYADQDQQLGTAHAGLTGIEVLPENLTTVLILQSDDSAFYTHATLSRILSKHDKSGSVFTLATIKSDNESIARVLRDQEGKIVDILEKEEVNDINKDIKEKNINLMCFDRVWYEDTYPKLKEIPGLNEIGLPEFVPAALADKKEINSVKLGDTDEWFGVNTPEELEEARKKIINLKS